MRWCRYNPQYIDLVQRCPLYCLPGDPKRRQRISLPFLTVRNINGFGRCLELNGCLSKNRGMQHPRQTMCNGCKPPICRGRMRRAKSKNYDSFFQGPPPFKDLCIKNTNIRIPCIFYIVNIFGPFSVMAMVCSNWAESPLSTIAQLSSFSWRTCPLPVQSIGSMANTIPGFNSRPSPLLP